MGGQLDRVQCGARPRAAGRTRPKLAFLMYPQAEVVGTRLDCLEPDTFAYTITATELLA